MHPLVDRIAPAAITLKRRRSILDLETTNSEETKASAKRSFTLREDFADHVAVHISKPVIASAVAVSQLLVINAEQVKNRGVEIVNVNFVLRDSRANIVGAAVGRPPLTPPPASHDEKHAL